MQSTGEFNEALLEYFDAECGAYTAITAEEIRKQTFNVKAVIRNLLIKKLGRSGIPANGMTPATVRFMLSNDLASKFGSSRDIVCKFSKPDKDEMTIYFSAQNFIPKSSLTANDYWCVYFKSGDNCPWFGYLDFPVMKFIQQTFSGETALEADECVEDSKKEVMEISYKHDISDLEITQTEAPSFADLLSRPSLASRAGSRTVSTDNMKQILNNKKIKGMRGEEIVVRVEKERLAQAGRLDLAAVVSWRSKEVDGLGYDIESFEIDAAGAAQQIFIEVKSTSEGKFSPFFVSRNEVDVSNNISDSYFIYRVYDLKPNSKTVNYYKVRGSIESNFDLIPQSFIAIKK